MRTYDMLSSYAISEQGKVIELDIMDFAQLTNQDSYKLLTDEEVYLETKNKTIKLWRRFTVEDIIKMWNSPKAKPIQLTTLKEEIVQVDGTSDDIVQVKQGKSVQVSINGVVYKSVNEASAQLSIHRNTIKKRLDDPLNTDYTYLEALA